MAVVECAHIGKKKRKEPEEVYSLMRRSIDVTGLNVLGMVGGKRCCSVMHACPFFFLFSFYFLDARYRTVVNTI